MYSLVYRLWFWWLALEVLHGIHCEFSSILGGQGDK